MSLENLTADIDLAAVTHNIESMNRRVNGPAVMAVVKANAYGHGLIECARASKRGGADWLGTAVISEALELRAAGLTGPMISWLLAMNDRFAEAIDKDIDLAVNSVESLGKICDAAKSVAQVARVHVKVDTGLTRNGVTLTDLPDLISALKSAQNDGIINVVGVMSHLAFADEPQHVSIQDQINNFKIAVDALTDAGFELEVKHLSNSAATLALPDTYFNLVRPGLSVYGISPGPEIGIEADLDLKPAMTLSAPIVLVKHVPAGTGVSYAHQYHTKADTQVALIRAGYADGIPRSASNNGPVQVGKNRFTVAGRVCMDQFLIDIGDSDIKAGDTAVLFGDAAKGLPTVADWANAAGTITNEIVTGLGMRIDRNYLNG